MEERHIEACRNEVALLTEHGWLKLPPRALSNALRAHNLLWSPELEIDIDEALQFQLRLDATNLDRLACLHCIYHPIATVRTSSASA